MMVRISSPLMGATSRPMPMPRSKPLRKLFMLNVLSYLIVYSVACTVGFFCNCTAFDTPRLYYKFQKDCFTLHTYWFYSTVGASCNAISISMYPTKAAYGL